MFPKPLKKEKVKKPLKKKSTKNVSKTKAKAWSAFSLYIRTKYADEDGLVACYTCGKRAEIKNMQAGHGIGGRNNAVLFMEEIVRPQDMGCNVFGRGQYARFTRKLIDELGMNRYDEIVTESGKPVKYNLADYEAIEAKYKEKLNNL